VNERYRLLLVDDVRLMRGIAKSYFVRSEFQVSSARSGREALQMAPAIRPHLIVIDAEMPEMSGPDCCRQLKTNPGLFMTPVILLTDNVEEKIEACWSSGCDDVLVRPFGRRELLTVARQYAALSNRTTPRIERNILVTYGTGGAMEWHDYAHNMSAGGMYLATRKELEPGSELQIEFLIPRSDQPSRCRARVAWNNREEGPVREDLPTGVGLEFIDLDPVSRRQVQRFVIDSACMQVIRDENR